MTANKIRILFIAYTQTNGGGAEAVLTTLVNNLDKNKYECTIQEVDRFYVKDEPLLPEVVLRPVAMRDEKQMFSWCNQVNSHFWDEHPEILSCLFDLDGFDVVVAWDYQLPSFLMRGAKTQNKIAWFHTDVYFMDTAKHPEVAEEHEKQIKAWQCADKIVAIAECGIRSLRDVFPMFASKEVIVHNGTDVQRIHDMANRQSVSLGDEINLLCVGRLEKRKNFILAIEALALLREDGLNVRLHILGQGELLETWHDRARVLGIAEYVTFHGYIQNPYPYIKAADILCITSFSEGWPTVVCEAMVLGKPFVTTPVSGASEELSDNGRCGLVSKYDAADYATKIKTLIADKALYGCMAKRCKEKIEEYTVPQTLKAFDNLIESVRRGGNGASKTLKRPFLERCKLQTMYALRLIIDVRGKTKFFQIVHSLPQKSMAGKIAGYFYAASSFAAWTVSIAIQAIPRLVQMQIYKKAIRTKGRRVLVKS